MTSQWIYAYDDGNMAEWQEEFLPKEDFSTMDLEKERILPDFEIQQQFRRLEDAYKEKCENFSWENRHEITAIESLRATIKSYQEKYLFLGNDEDEE